MFNNQPVFKANGTIAPSVFVKIDTSADGYVIQATDGSSSHGDVAIGISQPGMKRPPGVAGSDTTIAAEAADPILVYSLGDVCLLTFGGTVTRGDYLKSDANGKGITASTTADNVGAIALQSGTSGTKGLVQIVNLAHA